MTVTPSQYRVILYFRCPSSRNSLIMELTGMVRSVPRHKILFLLLLFIWVKVSVLDIYSADEEVYEGNDSVPESQYSQTIIL